MAGSDVTTNTEPSLSHGNDATPLEATPASEKAPSTLQILGLQQETKRYISGLEILSLAWAICISWLSMTATLELVLYQGGPPTLLYGIIVIFLMYSCIVGTLAELASVYPTAGGQYHWTAILSPPSCSRVLSYACGMINVFSWTAITAGGELLIAQFLLSMAVIYDSSFVPHRWQYFLIFQGINLSIVLLNCFMLRHAMWTFSACLFLGIATYLIIMVTCLSRAETFQPNHFVWGDFSNYTGWSSDGLVFLLGLVSPNYMYTGIDGALHLAEEAVNAATAVPRALVATLLIGLFTAFPMAVAMMYCIQDFEKTLTTPTLFPIYVIMSEASRSQTAATIFVAVSLLIGLTSILGALQTASRLTWSFARDSGLIYSSHLSVMNQRHEAPIWAICTNGFVIFIIGFVYLGSSTAFESFIGTGIILNMLSLTFPAAILMARGRSERYLPSTRFFKMPGIVGWVANFFCVAWPLLSAVLYDWPSFYPVTSSNMNYASAVIGVMAIFALVNWFVWARKHYRGPKIEGLD